MVPEPNPWAGVGAATALTLALGALLSGCVGKDSCGTGAPTPQDAVRELLEASAEDDVRRACTVTLDVPDEDLRSNIAEISAFLAGVGGPDLVTVSEVPGSQMGSSHVVEVLVADSLTRVEFDVLQSGGRYFVVVADQPVGDEETTDPEPPPTVEPSTGEA